MRIEKPYFMTNEKWFYFDETEWCYKLTDDAPEKAVESYKEFYKLLNSTVEY